MSESFPCAFISYAHPVQGNEPFGGVLRGTLA